jgi:hypothetical protein
MDDNTNKKQACKVYSNDVNPDPAEEEEIPNPVVIEDERGVKMDAGASCAQHFLSALLLMESFMNPLINTLVQTPRTTRNFLITQLDRSWEPHLAL